MISSIQQQFPFCLISFAQKGKVTSELRVMQTVGAQYIFKVHKFDSQFALEAALLNQFDPADRLNVQRVPGHLAFLTLEGNMQHVPMERLNPDDVYKDIQEVKTEAAAWVAENMEL